jgi:amidase
VELSRLRGVFHTDNGIHSPDAETAAAVLATVKALEQVGVRFEQLRPPGIEETMQIFMQLMNWDGGAWRNQLLHPTGGPPSARNSQEAEKNISAKSVTHMIRRWDHYRSRMLDFFTPYDLLICPTNALPAMPHGSSQDNLDAFSYTIAYSLTDWPAAVVRAGTSPEGLPIGVQIVAQPWREEVALAAAQFVESELGGWQPPAI